MLVADLSRVSDLELVSRIRVGEDAAFEEIVRRYSKRVFGIVSRFFRGRTEVEEAAQEVFLRAYSKLDSYSGRGSFEGWLSRIATNTCLNVLRRAKRRPEIRLADLTEQEIAWLESRQDSVFEGPGASVEQSLIAADLADKVLQTLCPEDRVLITLLDGDQLSVREVAEMTGWSESKVKVRALRARRKLRGVLCDLSRGKTRD